MLWSEIAAARHPAVRIPRKQSGQLRDAHAHVGRLDRALLQQRIARVFEDHCVTDLIGIRNELRRPQVTATLLGIGSVMCAAAGHAIAKLLSARCGDARRGRRNSRTIANLWNAENLWKICEISAERQWNKLTPRRDTQNALPSQV